MTPLDKPLRRALEIEGHPYTLTVDAEGLKLVEKGRRKGLAWPGATWSAATRRSPPPCRPRSPSCGSEAEWPDRARFSFTQA